MIFHFSFTYHFILMEIWLMWSETLAMLAADKPPTILDAVALAPSPAN